MISHMYPCLVDICCPLKRCFVIFQNENRFVTFPAQICSITSIQSGTNYNFIEFSHFLTLRSDFWFRYSLSDCRFLLSQGTQKSVQMYTDILHVPQKSADKASAPALTALQPGVFLSRGLFVNTEKRDKNQYHIPQNLPKQRLIPVQRIFRVIIIQRTDQGTQYCSSFREDFCIESLAKSSPSEASVKIVSR